LGSIIADVVIQGTCTSKTNSKCLGLFLYKYRPNHHAALSFLYTQHVVFLLQKN